MLNKGFSFWINILASLFFLGIAIHQFIELYPYILGIDPNYHNTTGLLSGLYVLLFIIVAILHFLLRNYEVTYNHKTFIGVSIINLFVIFGFRIPPQFFQFMFSIPIVYIIAFFSTYLIFGLNLFSIGFGLYNYIQLIKQNTLLKLFG